MLSSTGAAHVLRVSVAADDWQPWPGQIWIKTTQKQDKGDFFDGTNFIKRTRSSTTSGAAPGKSVPAGSTLIFEIDGEEITVVLDEGRNEREISMDVSNKVLALGDRFSRFRFNWLINEQKFAAVWKYGYGHSIKVTGGTAAAALKLGLARGGEEKIGVGVGSR